MLQESQPPASLTPSESQARARLHNTHDGIKFRCMDPRAPGFKHYGGRGITLATDLSTFSEFYTYMKELPGYGERGLTVDRIDNSRGYEKGNLRFATKSEQCRNRRSRREIATSPVVKPSMSTGAVDLSMSDMLQKVKSIVTGDIFFGWEVVDNTPTLNTRTRTNRVLCRCTECGTPAHQTRGTLVTGRARHCLTCFNKAQIDLGLTVLHESLGASLRSCPSPLSHSSILQKVREVKVGDLYGQWGVVDATPVPHRATGTQGVMCRCQVCGDQKVQSRGRLVGLTPTKCLRCFNRKQAELKASALAAARPLQPLPQAPQQSPDRGIDFDPTSGPCSD